MALRVEQFATISRSRQQSVDEQIQTETEDASLRATTNIIRRR